MTPRIIQLAAARPREGVPTPPPPPARIASEIEQRLRDDTPVHIEIAGEPSFLDEFKADWREFVSEVRGSPWSHALVAILAVTFWTLALYLPFLLGWMK